MTIENIYSCDSILYFPTVEFMSETWVKSALTIWDQVCRIVPEGYNPKDSDEIRIAKSNGFIKDIHLTREDLKATAIEYSEYAKKLKVKPDGFDVGDIKARLHSGKIDQQLIPFFEEFSNTIDSKGFYLVPNEIANGYMYFLAKVVSQKRKIGKLTDDESKFLAMTFIDGENNFTEFVYPNESNEVYSTLIIESLVPADIRSTPMEKIIELHKNCSSSKETFRKEVAEFTEHFSKIENQEFALQEINKFKNRLTESQQTKREILKAFFVELKSSLLYVGVPTAVTSLLAATSQNKGMSIANAFETFAITGIASMAEAGKELRKNWNGQKSSYYLEVKKFIDVKR